MPTKSRSTLVASIFFIMLGCLSLTTMLFAASTEKVLFSFNGGDGQDPESGVIADRQGNLYGTTYENGGSSKAGVVFELIRGNGTWTEKVLYRFPKAGPSGHHPISPLVLDSAGNLYGEAYEGGHSCTYYPTCGSVFELMRTSGGWKLKPVHLFSAADGAQPIGGLIMDKSGNLYGTTNWGGNLSDCNSAGCGTVFELSPGANGKWTEKVLHYFTGKDGIQPSGGVILDAVGNLYGTARGGGLHNNGSVFELLFGNGKWTYRQLHNFNRNGQDGIDPVAGVVRDASGNLYGTTEYGGANGSGTVFKLTEVNGRWTETIVHDFGGTGDGYAPLAPLVLDESGNLYGTTDRGDISDPSGIVFELSPSNGQWTETILHSFSSDGEDGIYPSSNMFRDTAGNLFGTTQGGGSYCKANNGCGTVYEVTP